MADGGEFDGQLTDRAVQCVNLHYMYALALTSSGIDAYTVLATHHPCRRIYQGNEDVVEPVLQVLSSKKVNTQSGASIDRYR